jgi:hypothetical protein
VSTTNDNQTVVIAFFALLSALAVIVGPIITAHLVGRQKAAEIRHREEREDAVADRVAQVAAAADLNAKAVTTTLGQIHTLVNSDMTAARTAEMTAMRLLVASLRRNPDDDETRKAIEDGVARIKELQQILADRLVAQQAADAQALAIATAPDAGP